MANRALIEDIYVEMPLGNRGLTIRVEDERKRLLGYVTVSRAYVRWYKGKFTKKKKPCREIPTDSFE